MYRSADQRPRSRPSDERRTTRWLEAKELRQTVKSSSQPSRQAGAGHSRARLLAVAIIVASLGTLSATAEPPATFSTPTGRVEGSTTIRGSEAANNAVVYLVPGAARGPLSAEPPRRDGPYHMDQHRLQFDPHVLVVPAGATVEFLNSDQVLHNIFAPPLDTEGFDLGTWPQSETRRHTFPEPGVNVLLCNVHPDMEAFIIVVPTRYYALTDEDGSFSIDDVPPGRYTLFAWHERCDPYEMAVEIGDGTNEVSVVLSLVGSRKRY